MTSADALLLINETLQNIESLIFWIGLIGLFLLAIKVFSDGDKKPDK